MHRKTKIDEFGLEEVVISTRQQRCFPNKLQKFKFPLVTSDSFPSRVSFIEERGSSSPERDVLDVVKTKSTEQPSKRAHITHWRRAEYGDVGAITRLIEKSDYIMNDLFGEPDVPNLIEKSTFSITQFNSNEELISFTSAFSYPDIPAVPSFEWYPWLENSYRLRDVTPRNCLFIHYMVWESEYYHDFLRLTLETMFMENTFLHNIIITKPPKVKLPSIIPENFVQVLPQESKIYDCDYNSLQTILLCLRHSIMERLKVRLAVVEDHDDLMPIVEQQTDKLRQLYGDFCMAEIIEFPGTSDRKTLVCESMGYAVGFMNINRAVDLELLSSQFDLGVFHGLRKPTEDDVIPEDIRPEDLIEPVLLPPKIDPFLEVINSRTMLKFLNWQPSLCVSDEETEIESDDEIEPFKGYNELGASMTDLIRETLNVKLVPKFSAHALSLTGYSLDDTSTSVTPPQSTERLYDSSESVESVVQAAPSQISLQHYNLPTYHGQPNAFCVEFFAMNNNFDDRLCHEFLQAAFEVFPDLEYCLLTIPSQWKAIPLLDYFTRVTPRPLKRFRQELYVCHKSCAMVTFMRVRRIVKSDLSEIQKLLCGIKNQEFIYADIASSTFYEDSAYQGFVLICSRSIVGVAVLCNEYGMEYLAHHYHVSDLIDFELHKIDYHAILKHLVLSPIYQPHARFFLRDIMRMADVTSLYRTRYEEAESSWNTSSLITVLGQLIPVKPKRMVQYHEPSLGENMPPAYFVRTDVPFSLHHINSRVCGFKKFTSNINLIIVGASIIAFSFLETLLFAPSSAYVTYHNITLVSPHGMGTELPSHPARDLMFPYRGKFNRFYKIQLCLKTYVNFVYGVMTQINRVDKHITINNDTILPYDYLVLFCGRQFTVPVPRDFTNDVRNCRRNYRPRCSLFKYLITQHKKTEQTTNVVYPSNVFLINTEVDATNALISLQYLLKKRKGYSEKEKVIIYGHHISTYLCVQALLIYGVPATMIVLVEPFPMGTHSISCFRDPAIDTAVLKTLKKLKIDHYMGYGLFSWTFCENKQIDTVTFHATNRKITLKCLCMFPFEKKLVSDVTFKAVNEASLVYDGKLVINSSFQTNDPFIYAAGGFTKYKRKYYAKEKNHKNYNPIEVGKLLAYIVKKHVDPTEEKDESQPSEIVPTMKEPVLLYGVLPGNMKYFSIRPPGKILDHETRCRIKDFGDTLVTGNCDMTEGHGYFRLQLDQFGFVDDILCYTKDDIDIENLEMLFGKHEQILNNLLMRFDLGMIKDLFSYFREPWAYALFHNRFKFVQEQNMTDFQEQVPEPGNEKILDTIVKALKANNWKRPSKEVLEEIQQKFDESDIKRQVTQNVLDFLCYFDEPFPMYATPKILRVLLHDANTSLLHKLPKPDSTFSTKPVIKISESTRLK